MSDSFKILADFLEKYGDDVEGRSAAEAPDEVRRQLRDFAAGHFGPDQRARISQLLKENPQWVGLLAEAVRTAGPPGNSLPSPN